MLQRLSNKEVRGPNFSVSVPEIHQIRYAEGERVATIEIEGGMGKGNQVNWVLYQQTLGGWNPPHEMDEMTEDKRTEILTNISESLTALEMLHRLS